MEPLLSLLFSLNACGAVVRRIGRRNSNCGDRPKPSSSSSPSIGKRLSLEDFEAWMVGQVGKKKDKTYTVFMVGML